MIKELSHQHHLPVWVYSAEEATVFLADGGPCDCLLKYCHSCMHKLISCDCTASAEIDGDKFGITMPGTMSPFALHFIFFKALSISSPGVVERRLGSHSFTDSFIAQTALEGFSSSSTHSGFIHLFSTH